MARYSEKQKAALDALMKDDVYRYAMEILKTEGAGALTMERLATDVGVSRGTQRRLESGIGVGEIDQNREASPIRHQLETAG